MQQDNKKWYFKSYSLIAAFLVVGPLALPLVWFNPDLSRAKKIAYTLVMVILTLILSAALAASLHKIIKYYQLIWQLA